MSNLMRCTAVFGLVATGMVLGVALAAALAGGVEGLIVLVVVTAALVAAGPAFGALCARCRLTLPDYRL